MSEILKCSHCEKKIEPKKNKPNLLKGFWDIQTKEYCCWHCRAIHYKKKKNTKFADEFQEIPIII